MKRFSIVFVLFYCLSASACASGYYLFINNSKSTLWFESKQACKAAAIKMSLVSHQYQCLSTK